MVQIEWRERTHVVLETQLDPVWSCSITESGDQPQWSTVQAPGRSSVSSSSELARVSPAPRAVENGRIAVLASERQSKRMCVRVSQATTIEAPGPVRSGSEQPGCVGEASAEGDNDTDGESSVVCEERKFPTSPEGVRALCGGQARTRQVALCQIEGSMQQQQCSRIWRHRVGAGALLHLRSDDKQKTCELDTWANYRCGAAKKVYVCVCVFLLLAGGKHAMEPTATFRVAGVRRSSWLLDSLRVEAHVLERASGGWDSCCG